MDILAIVCFVLGFILVIIEMFIPGFGIAGISGIILLVLGVIQTAESLIQALIILIFILLILGAALTIMLNSAAKGRLNRSLILSDSLNKELGYTGTEDLDFFLDKEGVVTSPLRPSGTADFNGIKLDVVSEGEYIDKDTIVKVIKVEGRRIVVKQKR